MYALVFINLKKAIEVIRINTMESIIIVTAVPDWMDDHGVQDGGVCVKTGVWIVILESVIKYTSTITSGSRTS